MSTSSWSTPADIESRVGRRWKDGSLLTALVRGEPFPVIEVSLRGPRASDLGDHFEEARRWVDRLKTDQQRGDCYDLVWSEIGGRRFGRNRIPTRAVVDTYDRAWSLLGVAAQVKQFEELWEASEPWSPVRDWILGDPHKALGLHSQWSGILAAYAWLTSNQGSGRYLREITAPGVHTKFVEKHRSVLASLLGVSSQSGRFMEDVGLRKKPVLIRLRVTPELGLPSPVSELALREEEFAALSISPSHVLVVENEITYLSVPIPPGGLVIWGAGYAVDRLGRIPWLHDLPLTYWGDVDTHGFVILDRLRARLPQTRSVLMDRVTFMRHRDRWGIDGKPVAATLKHLTQDEQDLYRDLLEDRLAVKARLEQELIDWEWAAEQLTQLPTHMDRL